MEGRREIRTHGAIDRRLVGEPIEIGEGRASVRLRATAEMAADERGLVHGGFVFGLADYAAMLAVNEPTVVLARADCRFLAPATVGDELVAVAELVASEGRRRTVRVVVTAGDTAVLEGELACAVPARHVFDRAPRPGGGAAR